jgi:CelD/BcsL family acetyltransferase involved in cellulose biosynthesis
VSELTIEPVADLEAARDDWKQLAEAAGSPFSTWEWASAWWRHLGADRELLLRRARTADGRVAAVLPLYLATERPLRTVRFVGHGPADQLQPVCAPGDRPLAAEALREVLREGVGNWHAAILDRLPGEEGWPELLGGPVVDRKASPTLHAEGLDFEGFLGSRSRNFRDQVRRRERRLTREHDLRYRLCEDPERLDTDFDELLRLHRARWDDGSGSFEPPRDAFHRDFARAALRRGWLRLWSLELDGRVAAMWLGYRMGGSEWYYQAGRDPALEREAVGFVLMVHTIREALNDGMSQYRLLLGGEAYKDRFANADGGLETVLLARGARGRAARAAVMRAAAMPAPIRRRLRRLAG